VNRGLLLNLKSYIHAASEDGFSHTEYGQRLDARVGLPRSRPAYFTTPLVRQVMEDEAWYEDVVGRVAQGRFGEPWR
jgi:hypothetical protein